MMKYAREDTHYLLYIYDHLRYQLLKYSLENNEKLFLYLYKCHESSNEIALKRYSKPSAKSNLYFSMIDKSGNMNKIQISVLKVVLKFRDYIARVLDYSPYFIWSNDLCKDLAKMSYSDLNEDNIITTMKKKHVMSTVFPFMTEFVAAIRTKYVKVNSMIDNLSGNFLSTIIPKPKEKILEQKILTINYTLNTNNKITVNNYFSKSDFTVKDISSISSKLSQLENSNKNKAENENYDETINQLNQFNLISFLKDKSKKFTFEVKKNKEKITNSLKPQEQPKIKIVENSNKDELLNVKRVRDLAKAELKYKNNSDSEDNNQSESDNEVDENPQVQSKLINKERLITSKSYMDKVLFSKSGINQVKGKK